MILARLGTRSVCRMTLRYPFLQCDRESGIEGDCRRMSGNRDFGDDKRLNAQFANAASGGPEVGESSGAGKGTLAWHRMVRCVPIGGSGICYRSHPQWLPQ